MAPIHALTWHPQDAEILYAANGRSLYSIHTKRQDFRLLHTFEVADNSIHTLRSHEEGIDILTDRGLYTLNLPQADITTHYSSPRDAVLLDTLRVGQYHFLASTEGLRYQDQTQQWALKHLPPYPYLPVDQSRGNPLRP